MPYCLIGKIIVWPGGIVLLAMLAYALLMAYDALAHRWRVRLLESSRKEFLIEGIGTGVCDVVSETLDLIGFRHLNTWVQDAVIRALLTVILAVFILPAFCELGLRYAIYRLRKSTAPASLA